MIKIENVEVYGWKAAIMGMRNPMNSWDKSDTKFEGAYGVIHTVNLGDNDRALAMKLVKAGPVHAKFRRMINVTFDITMPRYMAVEWDTYKVGTVCNSCSTMHKIHSKEFELDDFSHEHLTGIWKEVLEDIIIHLNVARALYLETKDKTYWWQMIQLLPQSYNQRRTVQLNYEVLAHMYHDRQAHKLDEWRDFCDWIKTLPYSELIIGEE